MTASNFPACLETVLREEGGFTSSLGDGSVYTNLGVTQRTWSDWIGHQASETEMRSLTAEQVSPLYRQRYWTPMGCDGWPNGVDLSVFDFGVNAGPSRAVRTLQNAVGVSADGVVGPATKAAVEAADAQQLIANYAELREEYYRSLAGFPRFGQGWLNRVDYVKQQALEMAQ